MDNKDYKKAFDDIQNRNYSEKDIEETIKKKDYIDSISKNGPLKAESNNINLLFDILKDSNNKNSTKQFKIKPSNLATIIGTLLYIISPIDLIPDVIPLLGFVDDIAILTMAIKSLKDIINEYKEWKQNQK